MQSVCPFETVTSPKMDLRLRFLSASPRPNKTVSITVNREISFADLTAVLQAQFQDDLASRLLFFRESDGRQVGMSDRSRSVASLVPPGEILLVQEVQLPESAQTWGFPDCSSLASSFTSSKSRTTKNSQRGRQWEFGGGEQSSNKPAQQPAILYEKADGTAVLEQVEGDSARTRYERDVSAHVLFCFVFQARLNAPTFTVCFLSPSLVHSARRGRPPIHDIGGSFGDWPRSFSQESGTTSPQRCHGSPCDPGISLAVQFS